MKLDENFRIETFNQLLLRYNNGLGKHPVLESKRPSNVQRHAGSVRSIDRLPQARTVYFTFGPSVKWTVSGAETERSKRLKLEGHISN